MLVLCFDITRRETLYALKEGGGWNHTINAHFNLHEKLPVLVLGLKRDLRTDWTPAEYLALERDSTDLYSPSGRGMGGAIPRSGEDWRERGYGKCVMPQEAVRVAQEMRADRYAECSAVTGELCQEVLEDISRVAALTTTEGGGRTEGGCVVL